MGGRLPGVGSSIVDTECGVLPAQGKQAGLALGMDVQAQGGLGFSRSRPWLSAPLRVRSAREMTSLELCHSGATFSLPGPDAVTGGRPQGGRAAVAGAVRGGVDATVCGGALQVVVAVELSLGAVPVVPLLIAVGARRVAGQRYCYWSGSSSGCQTARKAGFLNDRLGFLKEGLNTGR